ncbi:DUF427 domain-containing protein [Thalassobaculum sp.]|uniref:DUF427 domain-containing protein n=1 Tax=Thalassobaculum sp. TaxID=2022740 RepID=UPI0032EB2C18
MARATLNGVVLADSDAVEIVEGCLYFPRDRVAMKHLEPSKTRTICPWRGVATYYDVRVGDQVEPAAAWSTKHQSAGRGVSKDPSHSGRQSTWSLEVQEALHYLPTGAEA